MSSATSLFKSSETYKDSLLQVHDRPELNPTVLTVVDHDLKNPIGILEACVEMLQSTQEIPKDEVMQFLGFMQDATKKLQVIVGGAVSFYAEESRTSPDK